MGKGDTRTINYKDRNTLPVKYWGISAKECPTMEAELEMNALALTETYNTDDEEIIGSDGVSMGIWQVTKPVLSDYIKANGESADLLNAKENFRVAKWYFRNEVPRLLKAFGIEPTLYNRAMCYNIGIGNMKKRKEGTLNKNILDAGTSYADRYMRMINNIKNNYTTSEKVVSVTEEGIKNGEVQNISQNISSSSGFWIVIAIIAILGVFGFKLL